MESPLNFRSTIFRLAHQIAKRDFSFSQALTKSWAVWKLKNEMTQGYTTFCYKKVNGDLKLERGTTKDVQFLPSSRLVRFLNEEGDIRSFRIENLIVPCSR